jgi:RHS repeat-associated protein
MPPTLQSFSYADAPAGEVLAETDTPSASTSAAYTYDARGHIASMTPGSGSALSYGFDGSGSLTGLPGGATASYDHDGELTSSVLSGTSTTYSYSADGQRLGSAQGSSSLSTANWNGARQVTAYTNSAASMTSATYDGTGLRTADTVTTAGGPAVTQQFDWNTNPQVPQLLTDGQNAYIYARGSTPAEQVNLTSGSVSYLVSDALGSVRGVVGTTGTLAATTNYDAWGNPLTAGGLTTDTPFGYAGAYADPTGLLYLTNRYYDPGTAQFLSVDPDVSTTLQPYAYANGNPVSDTDPSGLAPNCGAGQPVNKVVAHYEMKRWPQSGYRESTLYCGTNDSEDGDGYGYRHLEPHVHDFLNGSWPAFDTAIEMVLYDPLHIGPGKSKEGTLEHVGEYDECHTEFGVIEVTLVWTFTVVTDPLDAKIVTAFASDSPVYGWLCGSG